MNQSAPRMTTRLLLSVIGFLCLFGMPGATRAQTSITGGQRMALVIGNDSYTGIPALSNARTDARAMARALQEVGFDVTLHTDLTHKAMLEAVRNFKTRLPGGGEAVFFFAGHGMQIGMANYLMPVDITARSEEQVRDESLALQRVLDDMTEQKTRFSMAIDRKSTRLNSSHVSESRMPSSA